MKIPEKPSEYIDFYCEFFQVRDLSRGSWIPFEPLPLQRVLLHELLEGEPPHKILVVKYRQGGCTTAGLIYSLARQILEPNTSAIALAHYDETADELFAMAVEMMENLREPLKSAVVFRSKSKKKWVLGNGSSFRVQTARTFNKVRLPAYHVAHLTEFAYYDDAEGVLTALTPALEKAGAKGCLLVESTVSEAARDSYFYELYKDAYQSRGIKGYPYKALFFPFYEDPTARILDPEEIASLMSLDDARFGAEDVLREVFGLDDSILAWRRKMILSLASKSRDALATFHREYPTTWEDAFSAGARSIFAQDALDLLSSELDRASTFRAEIHGTGTLTDTADGSFVVRYAPQHISGFQAAVVAVDPSEGSRGGDPSAICVIGLKDGIYAEIASASVHDRVEEIARMAVGAAKAWGGLELVFDANSGAGQAFSAAVDRLGYTRVYYEKLASRTYPTKGMRLSAAQKERMITTLLDVVSSQRLTLANPRTLHEMSNFGQVGTKYQAVSGHDDLVMALALGIQVLVDRPYLGPVSAASEPPVLYDHGPATYLKYARSEKKLYDPTYWAKPLGARMRARHI